MISAQQPPFPNNIQRVMDCPAEEEEETCEEQFESENCTCSSTCASSTAEPNSGLIQFKYCDFYGMLTSHIFTFLSLQIVNVTVSLFLLVSIFSHNFSLYLYLLSDHISKKNSLIKTYV